MPISFPRGSSFANRAGNRRCKDRFAHGSTAEHMELLKSRATIFPNKLTIQNVKSGE
jgi:hypothetical protein